MFLESFLFLKFLLLLTANCQLDFCDNNCEQPGLFCVENNAQAYTQCDDDGTRWTMYCENELVWNVQNQRCTFAAGSLTPCRCQPKRNKTTTATTTTTSSTTPFFRTDMAPWNVLAEGPADIDEKTINSLPESEHQDYQEVEEKSLIDDVCLSCLCEELSGCDLRLGCRHNTCGPYKLSLAYYQEANEGPDKAYQKCTQAKECSEIIIDAYLKINVPKCLRRPVEPSKTPSCKTLARVHLGGPNGCRDPTTLMFGTRVAKCYSLRTRG